MSGFDINQLTISGNLTADPELRHLESGTALCKIRIAHNERRKAPKRRLGRQPAVLRRHDLGRHRRMDRRQPRQRRQGRHRRTPALARIRQRRRRQAPGDRHHRRQHRPRPPHHDHTDDGRRRRRRHPLLRARARGLPEQGGPLRASPGRPETRRAPTLARLRHAPEPADFELDCSARTPAAKPGNH
jgi:hypothetical protein